MLRGSTAVPFTELTSVRRLREAGATTCPKCGGEMPMGECKQCRASMDKKTLMRAGGPGSGPQGGKGKKPSESRQIQQKVIDRMKKEGTFKKSPKKSGRKGAGGGPFAPGGTRESLEGGPGSGPQQGGRGPGNTGHLGDKKQLDALHQKRADMAKKIRDKKFKKSMKKQDDEREDRQWMSGRPMVGDENVGS